MIPGEREWDHDLIHTIFDDGDAKAITEIPLGQLSSRDIRIWHHSKNGLYTVKIGYHLIMSLDVNSESRKIQGNWKAILKMKVPPKIKLFIWHRINLQKKGIQVSSLCVICNVNLETNWHTFIDCPYARASWEQANLSQAVDARAGIEECFLEWFFNTAQKLSGLDLSKFIVVLWAIWKQRNSKLWENRIDNPCRAVVAATSFLFDWLSNSNKSGAAKVSANQSNIHTWSPPPSGAWKCNVDAAFFEDIKTAGKGMVIRNAEGSFIMARSLLVKGLHCVKEGEAIGVLEALSWIRNLEFPTVIFEVDAQQVSHALQETSEDLTEFGAIIKQCREILALHQVFR